MPRRKRKTTQYSFVIVPDSKDNPFNFKLSATTVRIILLTALFMLVLIIAGAVTYWKVASVAIDYTRLKEENFELRSSLKRVETIRDEVAKMQNMNEKIRESLSGYVQVENRTETDTTHLSSLNFALMAPEKKRTIFNFIPSLMPVNGFITRGFEVEDLSVNPHYGLDIAAEKGMPIVSAADGTVLFSGFTLNSGYVLIIKHNFGYLTVYKHNQRNLVSELEKVVKGQVIALVGDTGEISSGAHVHFEIWSDGEPRDPLIYVNKPN
jgi:murein DD-endopeptidase MepM/ murein hydrolase activator NlpD